MHGIRRASSDPAIHGRAHEGASGDASEAADSGAAGAADVPAWPLGKKAVFQRLERCIQSVTRPSSVQYRVFVGSAYVGTYRTLDEAREARDAVNGKRTPKPSTRPAKRPSGAWVRESASHVRLVVTQDVDTHEVQRPKHRGECEGGIRPCPWYSCRHHLGLDVIDSQGAVRYYDPERLDELSDTCSLDVADRGAHTLEDVGGIYGVTRERIRQIEAFGVRSLARPLAEYEERLRDVMRLREGSEADE